jgi:DNA polymerase elongation subunit (family B)
MQKHRYPHLHPEIIELHKDGKTPTEIARKLIEEKKVSGYENTIRMYVTRVVSKVEQRVEQINTGAKILVVDIETAPILGYVWGLWNQNVGIEQIESDWFCITWAAKWLFDKKVYSAALTSKEALKQDDRRIIKQLWSMLNEADLVIAHNGDSFDIPKVNTKFLMYGIKPPLPYQTIDTLKHIRKQFAFSSNKLDYVNHMLNLPRKQQHEGFPLWKKCYKGDSKAINKMLSYNIQDVRILEETYLKIRAWIKPHPNVGLFILDEHASHCPSCGSTKLESEGDKYYTTANVYEVYRCNNCQATSRKRLSSVNIKQRRYLTLSIPK